MQIFKSKVFLGTVVMTAFSLLVRVLGFVFRIRLADAIGAEGMGQYQLVTSVYMLCATLVTSGVGVAVTRLTAESLSEGTSKSAAKSALRLTGFLGIAVGSGLFFFAPLWTKLFLYDANLVNTLRILGPCMPFIAWCACFSGYFYGIRRVLPAAFTQLLEQLVRLGVVFFGLAALGDAPVYQKVTVAVLSISAGEILSCIYIGIRYRFYGPKSPNRGISYGQLLSVSAPIAANGYLNSVLRMVENVLIPKLLMQSGMDLSGAMSLFGLLKGMVMPLLQLPSAIISALSMNLMPALAAARAGGHQKRVRMAVEKSLGVALIGGILTVGIFMTFPYELGQVLYHSQEAGQLLAQMACICPLIYLEIVLVGALNSLGQQKIAFRNSVIDSLAKLTVLIIGVPRYGFSAYLLAVGVGCVVCVAVNFSALFKTVSFVFDARRLLVFPLLSAGMAYLGVQGIKKAAWLCAMPQVVQLGIGALVFAGIYVLVLKIASLLSRGRW